MTIVTSSTLFVPIDVEGVDILKGREELAPGVEED